MQDENTTRLEDEISVTNVVADDASGKDSAASASGSSIDQGFMPPTIDDSDDAPSDDMPPDEPQMSLDEDMDPEDMGAETPEPPAPETAPEAEDEPAPPAAPHASAEETAEESSTPEPAPESAEAETYYAPHSADRDETLSQIERIRKFFDENPARIVTVEELQDFFIKLNPKGFRFIGDDDPTLLVLSILNLFTAKQRFAFEDFEHIRAKNEAAYTESFRNAVSKALGMATEHYYNSIDEKVRVLEEKLEGLTATLSATSTEAVEKNMEKFSNEMKKTTNGLITAISSTKTVFLLGTFVISVFICSLIAAKFMGAL